MKAKMPIPCVPLPQMPIAIAPPTAEPSRPLATRNSRSLSRSLGRGGHELAAEILDLVTQLRCVLEPQLLGRGEHLLLELDDQFLELARRHSLHVLAPAPPLRSGHRGRFER